MPTVTQKEEKQATQTGIHPFVKSVGRYLAGIIASLFKTSSSFIFFLLVLALFSGGLGGGQIHETHISGSGENKITIIPLRGIILNEADPLMGAEGVIRPEGVARILRELEKDSSLRAIILDIESPGGSAVASDRIYEEIKLFKQKTKKPIITLMGDVVASGGYYISAPTDHIVANPSTITGSIGVIATNFKVTELLNKLGIKEEVYKKGDFKDILSNTRDTTVEEKAIIDRILSDAYDTFINRVAEGRRIEKGRALAFANGRIYSGKEAAEVGLVDSLGNLEKAIAEAKSLAKIKEAKIVRIETTSFWSQLFSGFSLHSHFPFLRPLSFPKVWYLMT